MIEDSLVQLGILENDSNSFVKEHTIKKPITDRKCERTGMFIIIEEMGDVDILLKDFLKQHKTKM